MSIQVVSNEYNAVLFCSTTMTAFGHVFSANVKHYLDPGEVARIFLAKTGRLDLRTMEEHAQLDKAHEFLEWLEAQDQGPDADDLEHMAKTGQVRCPDCGEWVELSDNPRQGRRCDDCYGALCVAGAILCLAMAAAAVQW